MRIGSDPETILQRNGQLISSHTANVPGTKGKPHKLKSGRIHRDNVLLEFNPLESSNSSAFVGNLLNTMDQAKELLGPDISFYEEASAIFPEEELWHPEALAFGCEGDISAWDVPETPPLSLSATGALRVAGGHVHIGYGHCNQEFNLRLARTCDIYMGLPSVLMDADRTRRKMYGQASRFRHKPYGMEYRVMSNFWIFNPELAQWVFESSVRAFRNTEHKLDAEMCLLIQRAINNYDEALAAELCAYFDVEVRYVS